MSVVRINVLEVPEGMGPTLEERFANRAGEVDTTPGFEAFELLRPTDGSNRYFVYTRWESQEAFEAWTSSRQFQRGHAGQGQQDGPGGQAEQQESSGQEGGQRPAGGPVASGAELLSFDVVLSSVAQSG